MSSKVKDTDAHDGFKLTVLSRDTFEVVGEIVERGYIQCCATIPAEDCDNAGLLLVSLKQADMAKLKIYQNGG